MRRRWTLRELADRAGVSAAFAAGSYNAKRRFLAASLGERLAVGPHGWRSVTHVMACLWSAEVLHLLRVRRATFATLCPDPPDALRVAAR